MDLLLLSDTVGSGSLVPSCLGKVGYRVDDVDVRCSIIPKIYDRPVRGPEQLLEREGNVTETSKQACRNTSPSREGERLVLHCLEYFFDLPH